MRSVRRARKGDALNEAKSTPGGTCDDRKCHRTAFGAVMEIARTHDGPASVFGTDIPSEPAAPSGPDFSLSARIRI